MIRDSKIDGEDFVSPAKIYGARELTEIISTLVRFKESGVVEELDLDPAVRDAMDHMVTAGVELALESLYLYYATMHLHEWAQGTGISDKEELERIDKPTLRDFAKALEEQSERDRLGTSESAQAYKRAQEDKVNAMFEKMMKDLFPGM